MNRRDVVQGHRGSAGRDAHRSEYYRLLGQGGHIVGFQAVTGSAVAYLQLAGPRRWRCSAIAWIDRVKVTKASLCGLGYSRHKEI